MKRSYVIAVLITLAIGAWLATGLLKDAPTPATTVPVDRPAADADAQAPAVQVRTIAAKPHGRAIVLFGRTEADRRVQVSAETSGRVVEKAVRKGQTVAAGDVLVRLAMDDREARLRQAKAAVDQRMVAYQASSKLRQEGFAARTKSAEDKALLEQARAQLAAVELDIARTTIAAPFAGVVEDVPVEIGDHVQSGMGMGMGGAGSSVVAEIVDLDPLVVTADVTEQDASAVHVGDTAHVRLISGKELDGTVRYVASSANAGTRTFQVEIEVPNPGDTVPDGLTTEVRLQVGETPAHRVSPSILTLNDAGELGVKIVDGDNRVVFKPVTIIDDTPDGVWLGGLPADVTVITVGQEFVTQGQTVRPVPDMAAGAS